MSRLNGGIFLGVAVLAAALIFSIPVYKLHRSCVICRLSRVDSTCLGQTRSRFTETECSQWYASHVEPSHNHIWERSTCMGRYNLLGMYGGVGCMPGRFPIMLLDPVIQMRVYQHFTDPMEAKLLFESLTDANSIHDRLDETDEDRGHLMVRALQAWDNQGYPGTWTQWWARFHADHVAERKEWLIWMKSDSHMNFDKWQEQRNQESRNQSGP